MPAPWRITKKEIKKNEEGVVVETTLIEEKMPRHDWLDILDVFSKIAGLIAIALPIWLFYQQHTVDVTEKKKQQVSELYKNFSHDFLMLLDSNDNTQIMLSLAASIDSKYNSDYEIIGDTSIITNFNQFKMFSKAYISYVIYAEYFSHSNLIWNPELTSKDAKAIAKRAKEDFSRIPDFILDVSRDQDSPYAGSLVFAKKLDSLQGLSTNIENNLYKICQQKDSKQVGDFALSIQYDIEDMEELLFDRLAGELVDSGEHLKNKMLDYLRK